MPVLNQITEAQTIDLHLNDRPPIQLPDGRRLQFRSGFVACLRDARVFTGRDSNTGTIIDSVKSRSWLGNVGYLILLDQIGNCFKGRNCSVVSGSLSSIQKALNYFSSLPQHEIDALYALRCALAHDYSLINRHGSNASLQHQFVLTGGSGRLFVGPTQVWDGNVLNRTDRNQTTIDVQELGNLVEGIYAKLRQLSTNNALEIVLPGGKDELITRYTIVFQVP